MPRDPGSWELEFGLELGAGVRGPGGSGLEGRGRGGGRRGTRAAGLEVEKPEAAGLGEAPAGRWGRGRGRGRRNRRQS